VTKTVEQFREFLVKSKAEFIPDDGTLAALMEENAGMANAPILAGKENEVADDALTLRVQLLEGRMAEILSNQVVLLRLLGSLEKLANHGPPPINVHQPSVTVNVPKQPPPVVEVHVAGEKKT
jgi:hypothetical protein